MAEVIGCIADDLTGATDVGVTFAREELSVIQVNGVPDATLQVPLADAVVIALKSRTIAAESAVRLSLAALQWLREYGAQRFYFKICSTFDSTPAGNIGPVADALVEAIDAPLNVVTPAYPRNGRTVYQGHLFVGSQLLSETGMRSHPLTPMTDSNLTRVLAAQTSQRVGLLSASTVAQSVEAVSARLVELSQQGCRHVIADAIDDAQLNTLGAALSSRMLATGGAGLAAGIAAAHAKTRKPQPLALDWPRGPGVILSGSCSAATLEQLERAKSILPQHRLDPITLDRDPASIDETVAWARQHLGDQPVVVYASAPAGEVAAVQSRLGRERAAQLVEDALRKVAVELAKSGVRRFVVAGGETAGAVVDALGVRALAIGPEIAPGVPWTRAADGSPYALALKSGNFGGPDFFSDAFEVSP